MKITRKQLKQLIKEELNLLNEDGYGDPDDGVTWANAEYGPTEVKKVTLVISRVAMRSPKAPLGGGERGGHWRYTIKPDIPGGGTQILKSPRGGGTSNKFLEKLVNKIWGKDEPPMPPAEEK